MKLILVGGGGFLLALGISTYLGMHSPAPTTESVTPISSADSGQVQPAAAPEAVDTSHTSDTSHTRDTIPSSEEPVPPDSASAIPVVPEHTPPPPPAPEVPANAVVREPPEKQVSRILAQMKPADAVGILTFLGDDEVARILCHLGVRQAAALMEQIPPERAATLTRSALRRGTPGCER